MKGLIQFLKTKRSKKELKICLDILQEFKGNESNEEYMTFPFVTWQKLEQLDDYLKLLTNIDVESVEDTTAKKFIKKL